MGRWEARLANALMMVGGVVVVVATILVFVFGLLDLGHLAD